MRSLKKLLIAAALGAAALGVRADFTAADALISAPQAIRGSLSASTVADLVEYARAGMITHTEKNAFGSEARIWTLDSLHADLQSGPGRLITIDLLPIKGDTVIAVIETLTSQQPDSRLTIYSRDWNPLNQLWIEPKPSAWGKTDPMPILLIEYSYTPENGILTLTNRSEEKDKMLPRMRYKWSDKGFKRMKE